MTIRNYVKNLLHRRGFDIHRIKTNALGNDPFDDMRTIVGETGGLTLFDVGANSGETVSALHSSFPTSTIHAFEPSRSTYKTLEANTRAIPNLHLNNYALGACKKQEIFHENSQSTLSSFLSRGGDYCWDVAERGQSVVTIKSLDEYCAHQDIGQIAVLKSDTQGFDLEVLKGSKNMLDGHNIQLILIEMNFCELYAEMPRFDEIYLFLKKRGFQPVCFYNQSFLKHRLAWMDGLFVDPLWRAA